MAQWAEQSFPVPEVRGSNPVFTIYCTEKTKIKKKVAQNDPLKKLMLEQKVKVVKNFGLEIIIKARP